MMKTNRRLRVPLLAAALCTLCLSEARSDTPPPPASQPAAQASIVDFGAIADGKTLNTAAIQKAIDHLAATGGGTLVIPKGTFLSGAIFLKAGVNLQVDKDGVLKGSTDISNYPTMPTRIEGHFQPWRPALVNADHVDHLRISGEGTLDGSGQPFWTEFRSRYAADKTTKNLDVDRPRLVFIENSTDVQVSNLHFKDSGFWNLHVYNSNNVTIDGLDIRAGATSPSTDGMDIDSSQNVTIHGCTISVNDDGIALKGSKGPFAMQDKSSPPVEHIRVSDCTFEQAGSILTVGSEATYVHDVVVTNCKAVGPATRGLSVIKLKLRPDTPQDYEDIHFSDITLDGAGGIVSIQPWKQYFDLMGQPAPTSTVKNVTATNIHGTFGSFGTIQGNPGDTISNITFENIDVQLTNATPKLVGVDNLVIKNVKINGTDYKGP
jgi:alpha-L-rhamnosidase